MNTIQQLIQTHLTKYPLMELTDAVKLLYQNGLGPGHMVTDEAGSLKRLCEEWENCINQEGCEKGTASESGEICREICGEGETRSSFVESIGNGLVRVYLHGLKKEELPILNAMFCQTANQMQGSRKNFIQNLGFLSFFFPNAGDFLREYEKQGYPPISHSTPYRQAYHPAYRVVRQSYADYLQLIRKIDSRYREKFRENTGRNSFIIAIDGNCASGKTSLSGLLRMYFDCNVIPMDDFFLPGELKTDARLKEAGGNIHYERFIEEVLPGLRNVVGFEYKRYDCEKMELGAIRRVPAGFLRVVEGTYSCHPKFGNYMDLKVFCDVKPLEQRIRIKQRDGENSLPIFLDKWIPREERYFAANKTKDRADIIL